MKRFTVLSTILLLLAACGDQQMSSTRTVEDFRNNNYNLVFNKDMKYQNIRYKLPEIFESANNPNYPTYYSSSATIRSNARYDVAYNFNIYYSIERFKNSDRNMPFVQDMVMSKDMVNFFHDGYVIARANSITEGVSSLKKRIKTKHCSGLIQVVKAYSEQPSSYDTDMYYAIATLKVKDEYYVFQWMCDKEMMDYTYDDFEHFLRTVRPIK